MATATTRASVKDNKETNEDDDGNNVVDVSITVFPKDLPPFSNKPIISDMGFSRVEERALKQAWRILKPFRRRFSRTVFFLYLRENHKAIETFRFHGVLDAHCLHGHAMVMMTFMEGIIEQGLDNHVLFHQMLTGIVKKHTLNSTPIHQDSIVLLADMLKDYLILQLKPHGSENLKIAFQKLMDLFINWHHRKSLQLSVLMDKAVEFGENVLSQ